MIVLTSDAATIQVAALLTQYPGLRIVSSNKDKIIIAGQINRIRSYKNYPIEIIADIKVCIPINQDVFPLIFDEGKCIDTNYPHRYRSGELCLATSFDIRKHFLTGFDLIQWMEDFVETYYYSYLYYKQFGVYPFGDRSHGGSGILQSYQDYFEEHDMDVLANILIKIKEIDSYRGHHFCFCGSGKKMRNCHGDKIILFYNNNALRKQLSDDMTLCIKEAEYERDRKTTK